MSRTTILAATYRNVSPRSMCDTDCSSYTAGTINSYRLCLFVLSRMATATEASSSKSRMTSCDVYRQCASTKHNIRPWYLVAIMMSSPRYLG
jgi:hypothetical protein